jgi:hypothetical protein
MSSTCWASQSPPAASELIPPQSGIVLEIANPKPLLDLLLAPRLVHRIKESEYYHNLQQDQEFEGLLTLVSFLEARFGLTWRNMLTDLMGEGLTLALGPEERSVLILESQDEKLLNDLHETLLAFARQGPRKLRQLEHRGVTGWVSQEGKAYTVIGKRILWASDEAGFKAIIDRHSDPDLTSLADLPEYSEFIEAVGVRNDGKIFVNLKPANQSIETADSLTESSNPLDALFSAGVKEYLRNADWAAMAFRAENGSLSVRAMTDSNLTVDLNLSAFARPDSDIPAGFNVMNQILGMSLYRDLQSFYAAKDELFPERTSGLIFFENMMGIFFSGRDFTDEVLAELKPTFQLVAARQDYGAHSAVPMLQLPAFALVFEMVNPETFSSVVEEAWQKALGLLNFTRGQQAQPGLIIDRAEFEGVRYSYAYFAEPADQDAKSDVRFNFRPALAMPKEYLILSSTDHLARDLIEAALNSGSDMARLEGVHTYMKADFNQLTSALAANREYLVQQNMLKKGNTREKAENDISVFLLLLQQVMEASLKIGWGDHNPWSELEISLEPDEIASRAEWRSESQ